MKTFITFSRVFRHGVDSVELDGGSCVRLDSAAIMKLERLQSQIPPDQRVMVTGTVDMLHHSKRMFTIRPEDGKEVRGVLTRDEFQSEDLGRLFGQRALVSGVAKFRPSGELLLIEADTLERDVTGNNVLSRTPKPVLQSLDLRSLRKSQGPRSGVAAVMGQWPGDESDEDVEALLAELS